MRAITPGLHMVDRFTPAGLAHAGGLLLGAKYERGGTFDCHDRPRRTPIQQTRFAEISRAGLTGVSAYCCEAHQ